MAQIFGGLLAFVGLFGTMGACANNQSSEAILWGMVVTGLGLAVWVIGAFLHWYHAE